MYIYVFIGVEMVKIEITGTDLFENPRYFGIFFLIKLITDKNKKIRYKHLKYALVKNHGEIDIIIWVKWKELEGYKRKIELLEGIWRIPFIILAKKIENNEYYLHEYLQRIGDVINETHSYIVDLRDFDQFKVM